MSDAAANDDFDADSGADEEYQSADKKKFSGKKIVLFFVLPVVGLVGIGGALLASGVFQGDKPKAPPPVTASAPPVEAVFFDLPEMLVNLNTTGRRPVFLKMRVSLELASEADIPRLQSLSPRIIDNFQVYLRELRIDDLRGSAGIYRLREELLARVNASVQPTRVRDVLFKEMLVQ